MNIPDKIRTFFQGNARTVRAKKNIALTVALKGLGVLIGFAYFPLSLDYLGAVKFGIFLTLMSVVDWFLNFDVGIGHGLRNKFGEAIAVQDDEKAVHYVSTAYFFLGILVFLLTVLLLALNFSLPWAAWMTIDPALHEEVRLLGAIIIIAFGIRFISGNIYEIFFAVQRMAYVEFFSLLNKSVFLVLILIIPFLVKDSLLLFGAAKSLTFALIPFFVGLYYFNSKFRKYRPAFKYVKKAFFKDLFSLGFKFFIIKVSMLVIHQTNNILIARFVSLEGVPQYEAAFKYLSIFMMVFVILNNQLWPSNLEAYAKGEIDWMRKSMRSVFKIWVAMVGLAVLMVVISPLVYDVWLGDNLTMPMVISIAVAGSICLTTWVNMYNLVLNGTGKITLQMYAWLFAALINIPVSLFFVKVFHLGVVGIVLGTIVSLIPLAVLSPLQVRKILSGKERGLWAK